MVGGSVTSAADGWNAGEVGDPEIDRVLRGFVGACDAAFPGRVRAYYLTGSWADGTGVRTPGDALNSSDIDVTVVFAGALSDAEAADFRRLRHRRVVYDHRSVADELRGVGTPFAREAAGRLDRACIRPDLVR